MLGRSTIVNPEVRILCYLIMRLIYLLLLTHKIGKAIRIRMGENMTMEMLSVSIRVGRIVTSVVFSKKGHIARLEEGAQCS